MKKKRVFFILTVLAAILFAIVLLRSCTKEEIVETPNTLLLKVTLTSSKGYTVANVVSHLRVPHHREVSFTMGNNTTVLKDGNPIAWQDIQAGDLVLVTQYEIIDDPEIRPSEMKKYGAIEVITP